MNVTPFLSAHLFTDGYKLGHIDQYPPGTESIYFNITARSAKYAFKSGSVLSDFDNRVVVAGIRHLVEWFLEEYWHTTFFDKSKSVVIKEYQDLCKAYLGREVNSQHWSDLHDLGYLPITLMGIMEGERVPIGVPFLTIQANHREFAWLAGYLETAISSILWPIVTSATIAFEYRRLLTKYADLTGSNQDFIDWQAHDFSARGLKGIFDGAHTQIGHLFSFKGTDTVAAVYHAAEWYNYRDLTGVGGSVPATDHSVASLNIQWEYKKLQEAGGENLPHEELLYRAERNFLKRLITQVYPSGIVSYVTDTYDYWSVLSEVLVELKEDILSRVPDAFGQCKLVMRPDSGDPYKIILGDPEEPAGTPAHKGSLRVLYEIFGGTKNDKGFIEIDSHIGLIYGDGINLILAEKILSGMAAAGWASSNIMFGIGSFTYQYHTRDDFSMAIKATAATVDSKNLVIYKEPKTGNGDKKSARGVLKVVRKGDSYTLQENVELPDLSEEQNQLINISCAIDIYHNQFSLTTIRNRLKEQVYYSI